MCGVIRSCRTRTPGTTRFNHKKRNKHQNDHHQLHKSKSSIQEPTGTESRHRLLAFRKEKRKKKEKSMHPFLLPEDPWRHVKAFTCDPGRYPHPIARLYASYCDGQSNFWRLEAKTLYDPRIGSLWGAIAVLLMGTLMGLRYIARARAGLSLSTCPSCTPHIDPT